MRYPNGRSLATVCLAFLLMFISNGFILAGLTIFDTSMLTDLGLSFGSLKLRDTVSLVALGASVPFVGLLLDRAPIRPIIVSGLVLMAAGFLTYGFVQVPWHMYVAQALLGASQALCGVIAHVVLVSRWTSLHRGLALGLIVAGSSLGNAVMPALNGFLLSHLPWRQAILCGGAVAALMIPVVFLTYRERPQEDCGVSRVTPPPPSDPAAAAAARTAANQRDFWLLGVIAGTSVLCVLGLVTNLSLFVAKDLHLPSARAQELLFVLFFGSSVTQILAGLAADRLGASLIHRASLGLMLAGMAGVLLLPPTLLVPVVAIFGIGWGGNSAMLQVQPVALFPSAVLGRTLGMLAVMETIGGAVAPALVGYGRDLSGSYRDSFAGLTVVMVASVICVFCITDRRRRTALRIQPP